MRSLRAMLRSPRVQRAVGVAAAEYLRVVWRTSRWTIEPDDIYQRLAGHFPIILAFWHGQHFMTPFVKPAGYRAKVLISRHRDGEMNAIAAERLGIETVRGSGTHGRDFTQKGGVAGFHELARTLRDDVNVAMTADIPKVSRVAGLGVVKLAQLSGRPILPVGINTHWRKQLNNWDRTTINLPFSRGAMVVSSPIYVPREADAGTLELARRAVEDALNDANARAIAIADRTAADRSDG